MYSSSGIQMDSRNNSAVVKIISVECIKPSTPTPRHLKTHKLSFLDQSIPFPIYGQMALFYHFKNRSRVVPGDAADQGATTQRSDLLKRSLSQTLSRFYPLAGRLIDHLSVDCNDEGVHYVDARVKTTMLNFLSQPDNSLIPKFHSCDNPWLNFRSNPCLNNGSLAGAPVAFVQANVFECGSVAICVSVNHMLLDGFALTTFIKCWGDIARGRYGDQNPDFITGPLLFPQNEALPKASSASLVEKCEQNPVTKRFVFSSSDLAKLKARATSSLIQRPTRFEVATALIWKCVLAALRANSAGVQKGSILGYIVNLRQRTELPITNNTMENVVGVILVTANAETTETGDLSQLVHWIRETKKTLKPDPLKDFVGDGGFTNYCEYLKKSGEAFTSAQEAYKGGSVDFLSVTGLLNSGIYETDFGWGKPEWATTSIVNQEVAPSAMNTVMLMDTKCGNGVEAWVKLDEKDMTVLQRNKELLEFSCVDSSPLRPSPSNARM